ncbi:hypothetical protein Aperf_G00000083395 [Anoplocephala perfoliata]
MSANEDQGSLPPDYILVPNKLYRVSSNWALYELDQIIFALERDNLITAEELHQFLPSQKLEDIEQLINFCLSNNDSDFPHDFLAQPIPSEESSLEIAKNSIRSIVPPPFSPGSAISSVLHDIIKNECSEDLATMYCSRRLSGPKGLISPNYARIYTFIANLFGLSNSRQNIEDHDVVAILDMIYCLLQSTDYLLNQENSPDLNEAFSEITDKIGVLVSSISTSYHHRCAFLKRITNLPIYDIEKITEKFPTDAVAMAACRVNALPYTAPILVIKEAQLSYDVQKSLYLKSAMSEMFEQFWKLPHFEENEDVEQVQKKLAAFSINPLGLEMETVPSLQNYFESLNSLMCQFEDRISSRVSSSSSLEHPEPGVIRNSLIQSAAKLIAKCQPCKDGLARRVSEPVDRSEIDKFFNAVNVARTVAKPVRSKKRPSSKKGTSGEFPSKMYKRVD